MKPLPTCARVRELLDYTPATGVLVWRVRRARVPAGARAGTFCRGSRCRVMRVDGRFYKEHRIVWLWMTGSSPTTIIDHKNRNALDNRWENLRLATQTENHANARLRQNRSLPKGVTQYGNRWIARIAKGGVVHQLGRFDSAADAAAAYDSAARALYGEFAATNSELSGGAQ